MSKKVVEENGKFRNKSMRGVIKNIRLITGIIIVITIGGIILWRVVINYDDEWYAVCDVFEKLSEEQLSCYVNIAKETLNEEICEKYFTGMDIIKDSIEDYRINYYKNDCYTEIAAAKKDLSVCSKVSRGQGGFMENCYLEVAVASKDDSICFIDNDLLGFANQFRKSSFQKGCLKDLGLIILDREAMKISGASYCDEEKFSVVDKYKNIYGKEDCYADVGMYNRDMGICRLIKNNELLESDCESSIMLD